MLCFGSTQPVLSNQGKFLENAPQCGKLAYTELSQIYQLFYQYCEMIIFESILTAFKVSIIFLDIRVKSENQLAPNTFPPRASLTKLSLSKYPWSALQFQTTDF